MTRYNFVNPIIDTLEKPVDPALPRPNLTRAQTDSFAMQSLLDALPKEQSSLRSRSRSEAILPAWLRRKPEPIVPQVTLDRFRAQVASTICKHQVEPLRYQVKHLGCPSFDQSIIVSTKQAFISKEQNVPELRPGPR